MSSTTRPNQHLLGCIFVLIGTLLVSCVTDSSSNQAITFDGSWETSGLSETTINNLSTFEGFMYAATDSGLYKKSLDDKQNTWASLGLEAQEVINTVFLRDDKLLTAIRFDTVNEGKTTLFLSNNNGESWQPWLNNFGGETGEYTHVSSITTASKPSDTIYVQSAERTIVRSVNGGQSWKIVTGDWNHFGGAPRTIYSDPYFKGRVWATGATPFESPYLLVSEDNGKNWTYLKQISTSAQICTDVISNPNNPNTILASLAGGFEQSNQIRKSTDGGQSWTTTFNNATVYTLTHSIRNPETVYASGRNADGTLFFAASGDFGDSWQTVAMPDSPTGIQVNDMVSVSEGGQEVLYLGTNKGLYSYRFEE